MTSERTWKRPHPKLLVEQACLEFGSESVNSWCIALTAGRSSRSDETWPSIDHLGGAPDWPDYWARVWGARGLLYCWDPQATPTRIAALSDDHWRVREMALKVVSRHEIGEAADDVAELADDQVPRVRAAAVRALGIVGEGEHAEVLDAAIDDVDAAVSRAASSALETLAKRLDRPL
jgi:HEAT repeats